MQMESPILYKSEHERFHLLLEVSLYHDYSFDYLKNYSTDNQNIDFIKIRISQIAESLFVIKFVQDSSHKWMPLCLDEDESEGP